MSRLTAIVCSVAMCLLVSVAWAINHYRDKAITYKDQRDKAMVRAETSEAIASNVITTMNLIRDISQANQDEKNQIALESQRAQADIKMAVENDNCARQPVPVAAADRLRKYADSLRTGSGGAASGKPDR